METLLIYAGMSIFAFFLTAALYEDKKRKMAEVERSKVNDEAIKWFAERTSEESSLILRWKLLGARIQVRSELATSASKKMNSADVSIAA